MKNNPVPGSKIELSAFKKFPKKRIDESVITDSLFRSFRASHLKRLLAKTI